MTETKPSWVAGATFSKAMEMAIELHADHARKVDSEPYLGHLLAVASNVIEAGGTETQAAAALLHDSIEDRGATVKVIERRVGADVAAMVAACTEKKEAAKSGKESWWNRKEAYLAKFVATDRSPQEEAALLVALADKVNNCEKTARDLHRHTAHDGETIETFWKPFNAGDSCQKVWYESLVQGFRKTDLANDRRARPLFLRLEHAVEALFGSRQIMPCHVHHGHAPATAQGGN